MIQKAIISLMLMLAFWQHSFAEQTKSSGIIHNIKEKTIYISVPGNKLSIMIDYSKGCLIRQLNINGTNKLSSAGIYSAFKTKAGLFSSANHPGMITVTRKNEVISLQGISYGNKFLSVSETWTFSVKDNKILWDITHDYSNAAELEEVAAPTWSFADLASWKGGILDNGGMVWCKYLNQLNDTYGVHTGGVTFWNADSGDALQIAALPDKNNVIASKFSHSAGNGFTFTTLITDTALQQRYHLSRFVSEKADVFASFKVKKGASTIHYELNYLDYFKTYSRGNLPGIDSIAVRELLNTTGRYGVVDNNIVGANGWLTNWKCLHEPFFAQIGMALGDENYTRNLSATLDQERDQAMLTDGRVLSRWHDVPGDEIAGTYNARTGYYEAKWGYTIDSQTGYVINASEQFDLNGDLKWLKSHQNSCERALDWLIKRDANRNGIFEMINNNIAEKTASDWLDIVWASYENSFVNAQMYEALVLWADCEKALGNTKKSAYYTQVALRLKTAFNKPVENGGFWSEEKKQYVYWRDKDGSVHGDNLVTPVNFAAIAFGLCDDPRRISLILDQIERRTQQEKLFHWPLCFDSFKKEEVSDGNWPFPKYENGDIFPTWGYLGIRAYAKYNKTIALHYINNLLLQYKKDGLSSQRYSRFTQLGLGEDVLAGISTSITALYRDIYGLRPKWNRIGLEPNMDESLDGTLFTYTLRDTAYQISLNKNNYQLSSIAFSVKSKQSFGVAVSGKTLIYYPENTDKQLLYVTARSGKRIDLQINSWSHDGYSWTASAADYYEINFKGLEAGVSYRVWIGDVMRDVKATANGSISLKSVCKSGTRFTVKKMS